MTDNSRLLQIEKLLEQEERDIREAELLAEEILPVLEKLTRSEIMNPVILKTKLAKIDKKYRDIIYALFILATKYGPEGSFIILTPEKVMSIIREIKN